MNLKKRLKLFYGIMHLVPLAVHGMHDANSFIDTGTQMSSESTTFDSLYSDTISLKNILCDIFEDMKRELKNTGTFNDDIYYTR